MDILGVGPLELLFIILIALIVIGPREFAKTARSAGRFLNRLYKSEGWKTMTEASRTLRNLPNRLAREAELEELDEVRRSLKDTKEELSGDLKAIDEDLKAWTPPTLDAPPIDIKDEPKDAESETPQT